MRNYLRGLAAAVLLGALLLPAAACNGNRPTTERLGNDDGAYAEKRGVEAGAAEGETADAVTPGAEEAEGDAIKGGSLAQIE